jgi:multiple sugar transport system permease protein/raffinose/stachyose/melibiose transport system permease protein
MVTKAEAILARNASIARAGASRKPWGAIAIFLAPVMLYYAVFILYPIAATFYYAFHSIVPEGGRLLTKFVGLENFIQLFSDDIFFRAVNNTIVWAVVGPLLEMATATTLAFFVYFRVPLHHFYRTAWFAPMLVSGVIVGLVFKWIFNFDWGLVNVGLRAVGLDQLALNWLGRRDTPLAVVIFVHYWATFGYSFILLLAGLSAVPEELVEAADIDGATTVQTSLRVLLPMLMPTFVTVLILSFMGKMRAFHIVWVLTGGGPMHFSETVTTYVQKRAFGWNTLDLGYPSAMAVVWFGVVMIGVGLIHRWLKSRVEY